MDFKITHFNWTKAVKICLLFWTWLLESHKNSGETALKNESRSLYVPGQIREINVLSTVAASLQSLSRSCRLHVARLKRYFIEVWGRSGRRPSSPRGHIFCPIRLISVWMADLSNPCDLAHSLYVYLLCAPSLVPLGLGFLCGFFCVVPIERPAAGHH